MQSFLIFFLLLLSGCMVGPRYTPPEMPLPAAFEESPDRESLSSDALCQFWKQFDDELLTSLVEEALSGNFDYSIALEQIWQARAQYQIQSSFLWPEIDLNASAIRSQFSQNIGFSLFGPTSATSTSGMNNTTVNTGSSSAAASSGTTASGSIMNFFQVGFDAIWELDFWGKFRHSKQAAFDLWEASVDDAELVYITIISEVVRDYVTIRSLQEQIRLMEKIIEADERQLELARVLQTAGLDNQIQVEQFVASLEKDCALLPPLETNLKQMVYALALLLGKAPEGFAERFNSYQPIPVALGKVMAGLPSDLLRRRPDIRSAERNLAAATEQIGTHVADLFPHIALTGDSYGYESNKVSNLFTSKSIFWSIGPTINWDLIDFGRVRGQIDLAKSEQRQALLTYQKTVVSALQDVEGALVAYFEEQKRLLYLAEQAEANRQALVLTEDLFQAGLVSELEELAALETLLAAEQSLTQSTGALTNNLVALYKALAGNW